MTGIRFGDLDGIDPEARKQGEVWQEAIPAELPGAALFWGVHVGLIFPLVPREKFPHKRLGAGNEYKRGSRDPRQIDAWWTADPVANIGITTKANEILIVDVDARKFGVTERWEKLCGEAGVDLRTVPRSVSPRGDGGYHAWFRVPKGKTYQHSSLCPGLDRPWQVPVPPSCRKVEVGQDAWRKSVEGIRPYVWTAGDPRVLPEAPDLLLGNAVDVRDIVGRDAWATGGSGDLWQGISNSGQPVLSTDPRVLLRAGVPIGAQNYTFKRTAMSLYRKGWSEIAIVNLIMQIVAKSPQRVEDAWRISQVEYVVRTAKEYIDDPDRGEEQEERARWTESIVNEA